MVYLNRICVHIEGTMTLNCDIIFYACINFSFTNSPLITQSRANQAIPNGLIFHRIMEKKICITCTRTVI